jgi:hypothetical protein
VKIFPVRQEPGRNSNRVRKSTVRAEGKKPYKKEDNLLSKKIEEATREGGKTVPYEDTHDAADYLPVLAVASHKTGTKVSGELP